jgi:hypothetical protein
MEVYANFGLKFSNRMLSCPSSMIFLWFYFWTFSLVLWAQVLHVCT